jgi:flagellar assembly protein FliH
MLSKVLRGADTSAIQAVTFPHLRDYHVPPSAGAAAAGNSTGDHAALFEKIRMLEARIASERQAAFEAGRQEAEANLRADLQPVLQRLASSTSEVLSMRADLRRSAEADTVHLALLIARRVLHRQLAVDPSALTALARVAFERLTRSESYQVTVHPQFAASISAALPPGHAPRVQIEQDPGCAPGTLVIRSSEGTIDASVDAQLEEISRGLTDRLVTASGSTS